jgi:hypothetical protein
MNKSDYRVVLDKITARKNEILISFFRQIPFMKLLPFRVMKDLYLYLELVSYNVN